MSTRRATGRTRLDEEIESQPDAWTAAFDALARAAQHGLPDPADFEEVLFIGCGSTHYLSQWAAATCRAWNGGPAVAAPASELLMSPSAWTRRSPMLVVATSRSARTTETVRAVDAFRRHGEGQVVVVTCAPEEELSGRADVVLACPEALEATVPQTRSFTSMLLLLAGLVSGPPRDNVVEALAAEGRGLLSAYPSGLASADRASSAYTFLGTGPRYGLACEAMLKVKEMALAPAEAFQTLEFRHGPISTVDPHSVVVGLLPGGDAGLERAVLDQVRQLGGATVAIGPGASSDEHDRHAEIAFDPALPQPWRDALYLPVLQRTAVAAAAQRGVDPEEPPHLQPVVILEE